MSGFSTVHMGAGARDGTLKEKRLVLEMTQQQVAEKAKISLSSYQKFESGDRNIRTASFEVTCRVLRALCMDPTTFFEGGYILGEPTIFDKDGRKYVRTGRLVDEDVDEIEAINVMRIHVAGSTLCIPMKILRAMDSPRLAQIMGSEEKRSIGIRIVKEAAPNTFRIPEEVYCGRWRGIRINDANLMQFVYHLIRKPEGNYIGEPELFERGCLLSLNRMEESDYALTVEQYFPLKLVEAEENVR